MQLRHAYPVDAAGGSCLVLKDYDPSEGVIDLDVNLRSLPPVGKLCLSAKAIRAAADLLGYDLTPKVEVQALREEIEDRNEELAELQFRVRQVMDAVRATDAIVEQVRSEAAADDDGPSAEEDDAPVPGGAGASSDIEAPEAEAAPKRSRRK